MRACHNIGKKKGDKEYLRWMMQQVKAYDFITMIGSKIRRFVRGSRRPLKGCNLVLSGKWNRCRQRNSRNDCRNRLRNGTRDKSNIKKRRISRNRSSIRDRNIYKNNRVCRIDHINKIMGFYRSRHNNRMNRSINRNMWCRYGIVMKIKCAWR